MIYKTLPRAHCVLGTARMLEDAAEQRTPSAACRPPQPLLSIHRTSCKPQLPALPSQMHHLLNMGAEVNQRDQKGWTPLHRAAYLSNYNGYIELYEYLLVCMLAIQDVWCDGCHISAETVARTAFCGPVQNTGSSRELRHTFA